MNPVVAVLREARKLIDTPEKWTQGYYAKDLAGNFVFPDSPAAVCYCAKGAIYCVGGGDSVRAEVAMEHAVSGENVVTWNDYPARTHADVLAAFDRAIEAEEAKS